MNMYNPVMTPEVALMLNRGEIDDIDSEPLSQNSLSWEEQTSLNIIEIEAVSHKMSRAEKLLRMAGYIVDDFDEFDGIDHVKNVYEREADKLLKRQAQQNLRTGRLHHA